MTKPLWAIAAAIGLHLSVMLGALVHAPDGPKGTSIGAAPVASHSAQAMQVRWTRHVPVQSVHTAKAARAESAAASAITPTETLMPEQEVARTTVPPDAADPSWLEGLLAEVLADTAPEPTGNDYLPRHLLSASPQPLTPVVVAYPQGVQTQASLVSLQLALYIDENGFVRKAEPQGERLEAAFEQAASDAFLQVRFQPGERNGQQVKARIVVEVSFETETPGSRSARDVGRRHLRLSAVNPPLLR